MVPVRYFISMHMHKFIRRWLLPGAFLVLPLGAAGATGKLGAVVTISSTTSRAAVPSAAIDPTGVLHIVWADGGSGKFDIFHRPVEDNVPGTPRQISDTPGLSSGPKLLITPAGSVHVLWHDSTPPRTRLYVRGIDPEGPVEILSPSSKGAFTPAVSTDMEERLHVAWADKSPGNFDIHYGVIRSDNTVGTAQNLSKNSGKSLVPAVATDDCGSVYVAWHDNSSGNFDVYLRVSRDHGATFGRLVNVSSSRGLSGAPALAATACGTLYVLWPDASSGNFEVMARRSTDYGKSFLESHNLSSTPEVSIRPGVKASPDGILHLTWIDGKPEHFDVYYRCIGAELGAASEPLRVSSGKGIAGAPVIDVGSDGTAHVVWIDNDTGPFRVFARTIRNCSPQ
jgi:hypothetical protein